MIRAVCVFKKLHSIRVIHKHVSNMSHISAFLLTILMEVLESTDTTTVMAICVTVAQMTD
jgi:hypothetical protein